MKKNEDTQHKESVSWDDVEITPESVEEFFNEIDTNALLENIDAIYNTLKRKEN